MADKLNFTVKVDSDKMRLGDLEIIDNILAKPTGAIAPFFEMLGRVAEFEGVEDFRSLPLTALGEVAAAIGDAVGKASEGGNSEGG